MLRALEYWARPQRVVRSVVATGPIIEEEGRHSSCSETKQPLRLHTGSQRSPPLPSPTKWYSGIWSPSLDRSGSEGRFVYSSQTYVCPLLCRLAVQKQSDNLATLCVRALGRGHCPGSDNVATQL
jgi:hypothetical protein